MSGIFICYRRNDSAPWAGRVYDSLVREWGEDLVFMDVDTIAPGEDFRLVVSETVARSDVVLVVIGPEWMSATDASGARRLDDEGDIHRTEIVTALASQARVIPVLVGGASMPKVAALPDPIKELAFRNAVVLEDRRFGSDVRALQKALARFAEQEGGAPLASVLHEPGLEATPEAPAAIEPGPEAQPAPAPAAPVPTPRRPAQGRLMLVAVVACLLSGGYALVTSLGVADWFTDPSSLVRNKDLGAGILPTVLGAAILVVVAALAFVARWRLVLIATCLAISLPLAFLSFQQLAEGLYWCGYDCFAEFPMGSASELNGVLLLTAAVLSFLAVWRADAVHRSRWAPRPLDRLTVVAMVAWIVSLTIDVYSIDSESYGSAFTGLGGAAATWAVLVALSIIGLTVVALRFFRPQPGMGALLGVALFPLLSVVTELVYLGSDYESPTSSALLWLRLLPALATVVLAALCTVRGLRPDTSSAE